MDTTTNFVGLYTPEYRTVLSEFGSETEHDRLTHTMPMFSSSKPTIKDARTRQRNWKLHVDVLWIEQCRMSKTQNFSANFSEDP